MPSNKVAHDRGAARTYAAHLAVVVLLLDVKSLRLLNVGADHVLNYRFREGTVVCRVYASIIHLSPRRVRCFFIFFLVKLDLLLDGTVSRLSVSDRSLREIFL